MAQSMLVDTEFVQRNGNGQLSDKAFVELLYRNSFSRDADAASLKLWGDHLSAGHSRAEMVAQYGSEGLWLV